MDRTRDDSEQGASRRAVERAAAALIRIGHLSRLHQDEAELFVLDQIERVELRRGKASAAQVEAGTLVLDVDDPWMSAPHAVIEVQHPASQPIFSVLDFNSRNGVLVNGRRVTKEVLRHGDVLTLGRSVFRFHGRPIFEPQELLHLSQSVFGAVRSVSPTLLQEIRLLNRAAPSLLTVLITGESGTGKEVAANEVHRRSQRKGSFVAVNCAAIPENMVEAHLFGHKKGAFTGANEASPGFVLAANGGTLFLDEIGDMPLSAQAKLLRVLEQREVVPLGEVSPRKVELRVVAATHADLHALVDAGRFRRDLLARLAQVRVELPPLRDRKEDLGTLLPYFCNESNITMSLDAARAMIAHDWPLNVRELASTVRSTALLAGQDRVVDVAHFPSEMHRRAEQSPNDTSGRPLQAMADKHKEDGETGLCPSREDLMALLTRHQGNVTAAARELGKGKMQLYRWMKRRDLDPDRFRS